MRILILFCLFLLQVSHLFGQTYTISGRVILFENKGLKGPASVILHTKNSTLQQKTDNTGRYVFEVTPSQIEIGEEFAIQVLKKDWKVANTEKLQSQLASRIHVLENIVLCKESDSESCDKAVIFYSPPEVRRVSLNTQIRLLEAVLKRNALIKTGEISQIAEQVAVLNTTIDSLQRKLEVQDQSIQAIFDYISSETSKKNPSYFFKKAEEEVVKGNFNRAIDILNEDNLQKAYNEAILYGSEETIELAINNYLLRANLEKQLERYEDAYKSLEQALQKTEDNVGILIEMADVSISSGQNQSLELFNQALEIAQTKEDSAILFYLLVDNYLAKGEFEEASVDLNRAIDILKQLSKKNPQEYLAWEASLNFYHRIFIQEYLSAPNPPPIDLKIQNQIDEYLVSLKLIQSHSLDNLYKTKFLLNYYIAFDYESLGKLDSVKKYLNIANTEISKYPYSVYRHLAYSTALKIDLSKYIQDKEEFDKALDEILLDLADLPLPNHNEINTVESELPENSDVELISENDFLSMSLVAFDNIFTAYSSDIFYDVHQKIQGTNAPDKYYELLKIGFLMGNSIDKVFCIRGMTNMASMEHKNRNYLKAIENISYAISEIEKWHELFPDSFIWESNLAYAYQNKLFLSLEAEMKKEAIDYAQKSIELFLSLEENENAHTVISKTEINQMIKLIKKQRRKALKLKN